MRFLYCFLTYIAVPFAVLRLLWRSRKLKAYRQRLPERFGFFDLPTEYQGAIWIHAASVGETLVAIPLIKALKKRHPHLQVVITTMTITGSERVHTVLDESVFHVYVPYDTPTAVKRFLKKVRPCLVILIETELWPNLIYYANHGHIPILLANGRMSEKSARGYARFGQFTKNMLLKLTLIAAQSKNDAKRFKALGANPASVKITGNIKFDLEMPASAKEGGELLRQTIGLDRPVLIAASTHEGEEEIILNAFKVILARAPEALLILVPRHPERFEKVAVLCAKKGFTLARRSQTPENFENVQVFLGDTMGELMLFFAASSIAFVGGSLAPIGGHNMLEPALFNLPLLTGPYLFNFSEIKELLEKGEALLIIKDAKELAQKVIELIYNHTHRETLGKKAKQVILENNGTLTRQLTLIDSLLEQKN